MLRTAEFVTPMHPDKICDRIADAILDQCLKQDKQSRCAIEVMGGHGIITVTGQITTNAYVNIQQVVKEVYGKQIGVQVNIVKQSNFISQGVDIGGAGDQGIMIGYACNQNSQMVPQEYYMARDLCKYLFKKYPYDGKTQITINQNDEIVCAIASFQNANKFMLEDEIKIWATTSGFEFAQLFDIKCNPAGDWTQGGFDADTGVTGRKIVVDAYGPRVPVGGGCYSSKDKSKVDRSAAYMARYIAKQLCREYKADQVMVKLAYAIGYNQPLEVSAYFNNKYDDDLSSAIKQNYDLSPKGIIEFLNLKQFTEYSKTAEWGHYGNGFNWDK